MSQSGVPASPTARYIAPVSRYVKPSRSATARATVLLPAPAGPSIAITMTRERLWGVGFRVLHAADAFWRPSNATGVPNTNLAAQMGVETMGARLWRLGPGQRITKHRHVTQTELYVVLEGTGRMRIGDEVLTLAPLSAVAVDPETVRQPFNDTDTDAVWLIVGAPPEAGDTTQMTDEQKAQLYPDGLYAFPPELRD